MARLLDSSGRFADAVEPASRLLTQEGYLDLLFEKADHLGLASKKSQSPTVSSAIVINSVSCWT